VQVSYDEGLAIHIGPESCAVARSRRSVDRGAHRPAIEARKSPLLGADAVHLAEGNTSRRVIASARTTRRGQRPWHVQTLLAREPGGPRSDRCAVGGAVRIGKARSRSR